MTSEYEAKLVVQHLARAIQNGSRDLATVPGLLVRIIDEGLWRQIPDEETGEASRTFAEYMIKPYPSGLGSSYDQLRGLCVSHADALDALDRAVQNPHGGDRSNGNNITVARPEGTTQAKALRRLRKDRPDLHTEVLADRMSAHAAMIQAGFRPRTITVRADDPDKIAATLRRQLDPETLAAVKDLL